MLVDKEKGSSGTTGASRCSTNSMNVIFWIIWRIVLNNPINIWEIKTSLRNVGAKKDACFGLGEFEICGCPLLLLLFSMNVFNRDVNIVKEIAVKLDRVTARHKDHNLFLQILLQESEEQLELLRRVFGHNVPLLKVGNSGAFSILSYLYQHRVLEGQSAKIFNLFGHSGGEKKGHSFLWQQFNDFIHLFLETDFEDSIGLIDDEHLQVVESETWGVLQVIQEPSRGGNEQVHSFLQLVCLSASLSTADNHTMGLVVILQKISRPFIILHRQLSSWGNHKHTCSILRGEVGLSEKFNSR